MNPTNARIYVASLSDYNAGRLYGRWIDASTDADAMEEEIRDMLKGSKEAPAEEWAIHDTEGFGPVNVGEHTSLEDIASMIELAEKHGEDLAYAVIAHECGNVEAARGDLEDRYRGTYADLASYAEDFLTETGSLDKVPEDLRSYFDFEAYGRDLDLNGDVFTVDLPGGEIAVFDGH